jgi:LacI family transcriptional regulator, galactose operon repressor
MLRPHAKHVTLVEVARKSGFSPATVSIVLNDAPLSRHVAARTKQHIRETAKALGYHPNPTARSLRSRHTRTIGILIFDISDPFCTLILRGIERVLDSTAYLPLIMDAHNERCQLEGYLQLLMERRVEGLIVIANWLFEEGGMLVEVLRDSFPTIVVGRDLAQDHVRSVIVDNEAGGYAALKHLYELGHRDIAFLLGPELLIDSNRRWAGMQRFAAEHGLAIDQRCVRRMVGVLDHFSEFGAGLELTNDLIGQKANFTALVAFDDITALGAVRALSAAGRTIPNDCSIIGFDDAPLAGFCTPGLTTIRQPMEDMGILATDWVLKAVQGADEHDHPPAAAQMLTPTVVVRESTSMINR